MGKWVLTFQLPIPRAFDPIYTFICYLRFIRNEITERVNVTCFRFPVLRSVCVSIGKRLQMEQIPNIKGAVRIYIGDDVNLSGSLTISSGRVFADPEFRVGNTEPSSAPAASLWLPNSSRLATMS